MTIARLVYEFVSRINIPVTFKCLGIYLACYLGYYFIELNPQIITSTMTEPG
jgi:hypothetical protein